MGSTAGSVTGGGEAEPKRLHRKPAPPQHQNQPGGQSQHQGSLEPKWLRTYVCMYTDMVWCLSVSLGASAAPVFAEDPFYTPSAALPRASLPARSPPGPAGQSWDSPTRNQGWTTQVPSNNQSPFIGRGQRAGEGA